MPEHGRSSLSLAAVSCTAIALSVAAGCESGIATSPPLDPAAIAAQAIAALDSNRSGALEAAEIVRAQGLRSGFRTIDSDANGIVTAAEIEQRLRQYGEFPVATLPVGCVVRIDGRPLPETEVRLVPEPFFGDSRRVVLGKSDEYGVVDFRVEGSESFGVPQGLYRIEVSKPDAAGNETLPARYNTQSQLGQEIAFDRREIEGALRLELSSR
jgi:hypothetical protein